ncbi:hypothetical protein EYF80_025577 [Liparis tanakae]|uniref:Uncharacterized protein n=1 Tax=Liparis tanakae TaxID=230148 RepID=A0A4Z2HEE7_9TELE|nr:hypothetical protein EYF80_025577 [Liparis tanakae]
MRHSLTDTEAVDHGGPGKYNAVARPLPDVGFWRPGRVKNTCGTGERGPDILSPRSPGGLLDVLEREPWFRMRPGQQPESPSGQSCKRSERYELQRKSPQ